MPVTQEIATEIIPMGHDAEGWALNAAGQTWFVPIHIARANGESYDLCRWPIDYADNLEKARQAMHEYFHLSTKERSMQAVIAQSADAEGVKREDLCLYLMCLGLINGRDEKTAEDV